MKRKWTSAYDSIKNLRVKYYSYFMWNEGLKNSQVDYSKMTKKEFINRFLKQYKDKELVFHTLQNWEKSDQYVHLKEKFLFEQMNQDFFEIYNNLKDKAIKGDIPSIKMLIQLKHELKSNITNYDKESNINNSDDDDGLVIE